MKSSIYAWKMLIVNSLTIENQLEKIVQFFALWPWTHLGVTKVNKVKI